MSISITPGQTYGRWTVLQPLPPKPGSKREWLCRCACGTERPVGERNLKYGHSTSCGCLRKQSVAAAIGYDLTGRTFGDLTVIEPAPKRNPTEGLRWRCRCACGREYDVRGSLLVNGKRTHCGDSCHKMGRPVDITGQRFGDLTALHPLYARNARRSMLWHCRCSCGSEVDYSYNDLVYGRLKSCGCLKREQEQKLVEYLTLVDGTSMDQIKSKKLRADNTTGYKGVYFIQGKYIAKIVFQKKAYYLGRYNTAEEAAEVRRIAEAELFDGAAEFYALWQARADTDPDWAARNPVQMQVSRRPDGTLRLSCLPLLN